jgi:cytoskeletal protein CcmA (bactofilin family)
MHNEPSGMGKSIVINGELSACEDLTVDGCVEGKIQLRDHVLTVGSNGRIKAQVTARAIVVFGQVTGNLIATEKVDIKETGSVEGDIVAPRVAIADGSHFRGTIDMQKRDQSIAVERSVDGFEGDSKTPKPEPSSVNGEFARI